MGCDFEVEVWGKDSELDPRYGWSTVYYGNDWNFAIDTFLDAKNAGDVTRITSRKV